MHIYGPSRTTVEKVVAIAKMSPGIVRFYFDSKAAMLVASLQFLASEFEEQVLTPVAKLNHNPVAGLELLVDLYLDPVIASPRKVSVWYAFWGEASSRQEYYDICGQKDESFAALVRELIERLIEQTSQPQLDPGGIALGLIGVLEMLWQDFAFRSEQDIDRAAAKRRCMAYLGSIFPGQFAPLRPSRRTRGASAADARLAGWSYGSERAWALERESLFKSAWQIAAHDAQIAHAGDFVTVDFGAERVLLVRDAFGRVHALRNCCPAAPHALIGERCGRLATGIECPIHGLTFDLAGARAAGRAGPGLSRLDTHLAAGLWTVGAPNSPRAALAPAGWFEAALPLPAATNGLSEWDVAANWKLVVETWLETAETAPPSAVEAIAWTLRPLERTVRWSARRYAGLGLAGVFAAGAPATGSPATGASDTDEPWLQRFVAPNQLLQARPDGLSILQAIPIAPGRSRLRRLDFRRGADSRVAQAGCFLARRLTPWTRRASREAAESAQRGVVDFGYRVQGPVPPALAWFRRYLIARLPALASERPPAS